MAAIHEFGIMPFAPKKGVRYDEYEPGKYDCICVDDEALETVLEHLNSIDFYWHTLDAPGKGLAYCGITLIPPVSMTDLIAVINGKTELSELTALVRKAKEEQKWIIHFGL